MTKECPYKLLFIQLQTAASVCTISRSDFSSIECDRTAPTPYHTPVLSLAWYYRRKLANCHSATWPRHQQSCLAPTPGFRLVPDWLTADDVIVSMQDCSQFHNVGWNRAILTASILVCVGCKPFLSIDTQ